MYFTFTKIAILINERSNVIYVKSQIIFNKTATIETKKYNDNKKKITFMAYKQETKLNNVKEEFIIDSRCTLHMTKNKQLLNQIKENNTKINIVKRM